MHFCPPFLLCLVTQSCLTLCDPMDCSLPGSSIPGILQARILKWIAMPSSSGSSQPRDRTQVFYIAGRFFTIWATREAHFSTRCLCILVIIKVSVQQFQYLWAWIFISLFCILIIYWVSNSMCRMSVKMEENSFLVKRVCVCVCVCMCVCVCVRREVSDSLLTICTGFGTCTAVLASRDFRLLALNCCYFLLQLGPGRQEGFLRVPPSTWLLVVLVYMPLLTLFPLPQW